MAIRLLQLLIAASRKNIKYKVNEANTLILLVVLAIKKI